MKREFNLDTRAVPVSYTHLKGYAPGSPYDEWLKLKDVYITERLAPEFMLDKELLKNTLHEFRKTKHFSDILNRAVQFAYDEMI